MPMTVNRVDILPGDAIPLSHCGRFELAVTGSGGNTVSEGYVRFYIDGTPVSAKSYYGVGTYQLKPGPTVKNALLTPHPGLVAGPTAIPEAVVDFSFEYGQRERDLQDCNATTESMLGTESGYKAVNSMLQYFDDIDFGDAFLMTRRPGSYYVCSGNSDFVTAWGGSGGGTVNLGLNGTFGGINAGQQTFAIAAESVVLIPTLQVFGSAGPGDFVSVEIVGTNGYRKSFEIHVKSCCCPGQTLTVHFLENIGGWSTLAFECLEGLSAIRNHTRVCIADGCFNNPGRTSLMDAGSNIRPRFRGSFDVNKPQDINFFAEFFTSRKHLLEMDMPDGSKALIPYTVVNGTYEVADQTRRIDLEFEMEPETWNVL